MSKIFCRRSSASSPVRRVVREFSRNVHRACYRDVVERQFGSWDEERQGRFFVEGWKEGESQIVERDGVPIGVFRRQILDDHIFIREIQILPRA